MPRYFIILTLLLFYSCFNKKEKCIQNYILEIPLTVSPKSNVLHTGDTLIVSMTTDNTKIYDNNDDRFVNFPHFDPKAYFIMPLLDSFPVSDGFIENEVLVENTFGVIHKNVRTLSSGLLFVGIEKSTTNSFFEFKVVLKRPGLYALYGLTTLFEVDNNNHTNFPDRCRSGSLSVVYYYNDEEVSFDKSFLTDHQKEVEDQLWEFRWGQRLESFPYYFRVE